MISKHEGTVFYKFVKCKSGALDVAIEEHLQLVKQV